MRSLVCLCAVRPGVRARVYVSVSVCLCSGVCVFVRVYLCACSSCDVLVTVAEALLCICGVAEVLSSTVA